jgi:hypothetical protein
VTARHLVVVVLDSCRFDTFLEARPRSLARLGEIERRWSYASWTSPSHFNLLMGLLPHRSPKGVFASDVYRGEYRRFEERLGIEGVSFSAMLPHLWLPELLQGLGYRTEARVSLPVLNPATPINRAFDRYELMERHNDMAAMLPTLPSFDQPTFLLLNVGETHYPYALSHEPSERWPKVHGVHGVLAHATAGSPSPFDPQQLSELRARQVAAVRYLDDVIDALFTRLPKPTWVVVTSDHGELFGEDGFFGHGPILHDKVLEVPFVEGLLA